MVKAGFWKTGPCSSVAPYQRQAGPPSAQSSPAK